MTSQEVLLALRAHDSRRTYTAAKFATLEPGKTETVVRYHITISPGINRKSISNFQGDTFEEALNIAVTSIPKPEQTPKPDTNHE